MLHDALTIAKYGSCQKTARPHLYREFAQMEIILHAEPGTVLNWNSFQATRPPNSMALDGYVSGISRFTRNGPYANFNHHEDVDRIATRSTCMQIFFAMKLGLLDAFAGEKRSVAHVFVNDADQDVCLSCWLLRNSDRAMATRWHDPLTPLMVYEDLMDASAGAFPFNDTHDPNSLLRRQAWVFEPYTQARADRILHTMNDEGLARLIDEVGERISMFADNRGGSVDLDTFHEVIGGGAGWRMVKNPTVYARTVIYADGIRAFISVRDRTDGRYTYVVGKMSPYVPFPLEKIYEALNEAEGTTMGENSWGGSDIIGGSPRGTGSSLAPRQVEQLVNTILQG